MPTYAIGDLQGCYDELEDLLNEISFDQQNDQLWFVGDLVNRGPKSLQCLQFVIDLGECARTVLGNHDLHLLAVACGVRPPHRKDTFDEILGHPDRAGFLDWTRKQPLMTMDKSTGYCLVHAGLFPQWSGEEALYLSREVSEVLRGDRCEQFIGVMYGEQPDAWSDELRGYDRLRCLVNCFTRMRFLDEEGRMNFSEKGAPGSQGEGLVPWYRYPGRKSRPLKIVFGHWSTIYQGKEKNFAKYNVYPLDTGCLWGGKLTALRLEDEKWFAVPSRQPKLFS